MAGSETMLHTMMRSVAEAGHEAHVVVSDLPDAPPTWEYQGVTGHSRRGVAEATRFLRQLRPDVIVTHHQNAIQGIMEARRLGVQSVFIQHNSFGLNRQILALRPDLTVFNTEWIKAMWGQQAGRSIVIHPPVRADDHATTPGNHVTLINLNRHKGVDLFYRLARHFPHQPFLGVHGGHGQQIVHGAPPNVRIIPQTNNMRDDVWARTRVLLVPSVYESYGMVAAEALCSGIPVMANATPGLQECLGAAGIWPGGVRAVTQPVPSNIVHTSAGALAQWVAILRRLLTDHEEWERVSAVCRQRSAELAPGPEMARWVAELEAMAPAKA